MSLQADTLFAFRKGVGAQAISGSTRLSACDRPKLSSCHSSSMVLAPTRTISRAVNRHQIPIEPAAAGCSPIRDFVHCRFADAGRRWVWLRFPTAGIRKPLHKPTNALQQNASTDSCSYSITSLARTSSAGGIVSPSALAVLRLMTRSKRLGRSIGISPTLAPLRIRSTTVAARLYMSGRFGPYAISPPDFGKRVNRLIVGRRVFNARSAISVRSPRMSGEENPNEPQGEQVLGQLL
jgi:hypothetical protein